MEAVAAGATGYLQKETDRERLLSTVRDAVSGELRVPVEVVRRAFEEILGLQGYVLRSDSGGEGDQAGDGSERHLWHPAEVGCRVNAGVGALVRAERTAGWLAARTAFEVMLLQTASELTFRWLAYTVLVRITSSAIELRLDAHRSPPPHQRWRDSHGPVVLGTRHGQAWPPRLGPPPGLTYSL